MNRRLAILVSVALALALMASGVARAEDAASDANATSTMFSRAQDAWREWNRTIAETIGPLELGLLLTGYYDWHDTSTIAGKTYHSVDGAGGVAQLTFDWTPVEGGSLQGEFRYGQGHGATKKLVRDDATLGNINQLGSDTTNRHVQVFSLFYQQQFLDGQLFAAFGKSEPEAWIDQNSYAGDEFGQFVDQALVADPVLDNEDEQMPMVAMGGEIADGLQAQAVVLASSQGGEKDEFDRPLETPFVGAQLSWTTETFGLRGTYRLVGFTATYQHDKLQGDGKKPGYSAGINVEQQLTETIAVFGRAYWHDEEVYTIPWAFSCGVSADGLIPGRDDDVLGLGAAFLVSDDVVNSGGTETHLEMYYKLAIGEHLFLTPDARYVLNPQGNGGNNGLFAAQLRLQLEF